MSGGLDMNTGEPTKVVERERPLGLFIAVIQEDPKADQTVHRRRMRDLLLSPGYEDFQDAVIDEWMRIKYSTAFTAACPPTIKELTVRAERHQRAEFEKQAAERAAAREARRQEEQRKEDEEVVRVTALMASRMLDFIMPNGKPLRACTGAECAAAGGFFARIAERVGATQIVGAVLSEADLASIKTF